MLASDDPWLKTYFHGKRAQSLVGAELPPAQGQDTDMETRANYALIGLFTLAWSPRPSASCSGSPRTPAPS